MNILCDTCCVLMLIRIAPEMFLDNRYECVTIQEVYQELFRTQKFKEKYSWRSRFKKNIKALEISKVRKGDFDLYFQVVNNMVQTGKINERTGHFFNLSHIDQIVAACSIAHKFKLTTTDGDLNDFIIQEFSGSTISPLGIINNWMERGLIKWNDDRQTIIDDWTSCNETSQPKEEIKRFEKLSKSKYTGP
jgi:hypothetical protein